ncbi:MULTISPECIES: ABC transporter ATP-binding protein [Frankia]|uniref:High-affinity branched-chain amino acid transport protein (ABC superfamily, atp_bind) n=1 Tax=Frankia alni (strain DSM 45986 / CECT 9034 / ACN14a) TaxID=326424 RepID=Q0RKF4_FRAAA|nr:MULTISPECIES: ABC transporter ATP-binding protein [Frankia]CAJ62004.1 high-affinity branched-chain amino acid transport protein (ABC superfamily, atp_bind) [Frankia alni ACN14a]
MTVTETRPGGEGAAAAPATPVLEVRGLDAGYGSSAVLHDVSLTVPRGSVVALLGPNGAGKTTLLRVASGLLRPTRGEVILDGRDVTRARPYQRARGGLCHIPEGRGVYPSLTVRENLVLHTWKRNVDDALERAVANFPILGSKLSQPAGELSGGQQQMLAVMRAYLDEPSVVLVDEVSMGLAPVIVDQIYEFLDRIRQAGTSLLLVEQYVHRALAAADRVCVLTKGRIVFDGRPEDVAEEVFEHYLGVDPNHGG